MDGPGFQEAHTTQAKHMVFLFVCTVVISLLRVSIGFLASAVLHGVGFMGTQYTQSPSTPFSKIGSPIYAAFIY